MFRRTKIIATLGPVTRSAAAVEALVDAGMDAARLNCAHETAGSLQRRVRIVRRAARKAGRAVATLADLAGPKMRTGEVPAGGVELKPGTRFVITSRAIEGTADTVSTTYPQLARDVRPGDFILIDDGLLKLRVLKAADGDVQTEVVVGGILSSRKGLNLPGVPLSGPSLTVKDRADLQAAVAAGVDYLAVSFVQRARDIETVRGLLARMDREDMPLIAKIERPEALENLDEILKVSDGVMVARGDLGVETSSERVPIVQKWIIREANSRGKIAITATQMLDSMISHPMPTRAEASDVANAILDGSDAVMLSGETSVGEYPIEAVRTLDRLATYTEQHADFGERPHYQALIDRSRVEHAIAAAAREAAATIDASYIVAFTDSGATVRQVSRMRPRCGIFGFTTSEHVFRRLALRWGVRPMRNRRFRTTDQMLKKALDQLRSERYIASGDRLVLVCGTHQLSGATNMMKVEIS
jgi:pyruvate kinase